MNEQLRRMVLPVRAIASREHRKIYFEGVVARRVSEGRMSEQEAVVLLSQANNPRVDGHLINFLATTVGGHVLGTSINAPLSGALAFWGVENNNWWAVAYAAYMHVPLAPKVNGQGLVRGVYHLGIAVVDRITEGLKREEDRHRLPSIGREIGSGVFSLFSPIGNGSTLVRMGGEMPELSGLLMRKVADQIEMGAKKSRVLAGRSEEIGNWFYRWCYQKWVPKN